MHRYDSTDGGILVNISDNGRWGIIELGTSAGGGNATPKLYDVQTEEAMEVRYQGDVIAISDVTDDGNIVVGSLHNQPVAYNRATGKLTAFPMRSQWQWGSLSSVTPDGQWAVGQYSGYTGVFEEDDELTGDYYFSPLMVNVQTGDTLALPGLPTLDMAHLDQHALALRCVSPDGRYVVGSMDWYILEPNSGVTFVYDVWEHSYSVIGFEEHAVGPWQPLYPDLHHIEGCTMSPDGHYLAGAAYITKPQPGSEFFNEYVVPFRYDVLTSDFEVFDDAESNNIAVGAVSNQGVLFGNPDTGSPLRNFRILYKDKYWISFTQICQQVYGFNFQARTGYEYTGTVTAVSGDGRSLVSFPDPLAESYLFDLGAAPEEICSRIDLLSNYTVSPLAGTAFARISNIEINFGRGVQVLGDGSNVHLYTSDGTLVYNGLSNGGLTLKAGSNKTVVAAFRTRPLEAGVNYELVIDAGAICVSGDPTLSNKEIRIPYVGRTDGPVQVTKIVPAEGAELRQIDNSSSYILMDFDTPILTTDYPLAYIERVEDGSRLGTLNVAAGTQDATRHQLLLTPSSTLYLYAGESYRLVLEQASVSDYSGNTSSYNERFETIYKGTYVREAAMGNVLFADDFNDPNACLNTWLRFEGDHLTPTGYMQAWGFDADNNPWNYTLHDTEESPDYFAGSHSMYSPSGTSDDWMITPQLTLPAEGEAMLEFDAQSYDPNRKDYLSVYVYAYSHVLSYLSQEIMAEIREKAVLLDSILLEPGDNPETTEGEWRHYSYSLAPWAGQDVYVAFVNQNTNQSAIFVDNVTVQRDVPYAIAFSNDDRVVAKDEIEIAGRLTVLCDESDGPFSLTLRDTEGKEISKLEWNDIPEMGTSIPFAFEQPLPLTIGQEVTFSIDIRIGQKQDTYTGTIANLAFEPVKHAVLEEMTGSTCINCPLGIVAIEKCEQAFGERFIPVGIHSYTGDNLGSAFMDYSAFLGLNAAPLARINRLPGTYSPMYHLGDEFYYRDIEDEPLWYDVVSAELNHLTTAQLLLTAQADEANQQIDYSVDLQYALNATNQQLSLLIVLLEDQVTSYQFNAFSSATSETLAEWCNGGPYAEYAIYPYVHNHVVRSVIGQTFSGTIGLFPSELQSGITYNAKLSSSVPASIVNLQNLKAVAMLIDTQSGEVINAIQSAVSTEGQGIENIAAETSHTDRTLRNLSGAIIRANASEEDVQSLPSGIYLLGERKILVEE